MVNGTFFVIKKINGVGNAWYRAISVILRCFRLKSCNRFTNTLTHKCYLLKTTPFFVSGVKKILIHLFVINLRSKLDSFDK